LKEVGVRKVIGGVKRQVLVQFISESLLLAIFSGSLALCFYEMLRGYFGEVLAVSLPSILENEFIFWFAVAMGILLIGLTGRVLPFTLFVFHRNHRIAQSKV